MKLETKMIITAIVIIIACCLALSYLFSGIEKATQECKDAGITTVTECLNQL
jgi:uncharacterized protein YpmB